MHSHGQAFKLWKTLKQAKLKLSPPNKPRSTSKTPGKLSTLNTAPTYLKKHLETTHGSTQRTSQEVPFILQTIITQDESDGTKDRNWLYSSILDKSAFDECIKTLSNNKSPEPSRWYCKWASTYATHRNPGNHTHAFHYYVGIWLHAKSLENQQYYTNRQKQRRCNGGIFLSPNWLGKYPLQTMDASHHKHSLRICRAKSILSTTQAGFCKQEDPIHQLKNVIMALEDA